MHNGGDILASGRSKSAVFPASTSSKLTQKEWEERVGKPDVINNKKLNATKKA